ncbi:PEP-CTERM sorting domain-containing protein [Massilia sp. YMA4]|uniref:PEP-CTERM sorting domain-containing protein n=1 Tax=Massilia sp. YMA4 TaxID=1593482 RepID=UPI000DD172FD|nr:PEP-CTERM sorting domain-containing protein [Massilia sp. YMA4]AXA89795.1 hypothetical protein DPH57_00560 [Massilia sp. YMA4]
MNPKHLAAALCSLFVGTAASAAGPVSTTSLGVSHTSISVFDLTPADGVAAGYTTRDLRTTLEASLYRTGWDGSANGYAVDHPLDAGTAELQYRSEYANATWNGAWGGLSLSVTSTQSSFDARATANQYMLVTLAPHTGFVFSGLVAQSSVNPAVEPWSYQLTSGFAAQISDPADLDHELLFERKLGGENASDYTQTDPFSLTYVNDTDLPRELHLSVRTYAFARAPALAVSAVPEPSTYLMLGTGLLGICWRARRSERA